MENGANQFERLVRVTHAVAMSQKELMAINLRRLFLFVQNDATLLLQVFIGPDVVIACKVMHLDTHVGQFRQLTQKPRKTFGNDILVLIPEIKHIAQQINGGSLLLDTVKETHQSAFLHTLMRNGQRTQVGIGKEIDVLHNYAL